MSDACVYLGRWHWHPDNNRAVYSPCEKCGQSIDAPLHNDGSPDA